MHWKSGRAYSQDVRDRVFAAIDAGASAREVARRFDVSVSYVYKALIRRRREGVVSARPWRGRPPRKLDRHAAAIEAHIAANRDITLRGLAHWLAQTHGVRVSVKAVWSTVHRLGLTLKKSPARGGAGPARRGAGAAPLADLATAPRA